MKRNLLTIGIILAFIVSLCAITYKTEPNLYGASASHTVGNLIVTGNTTITGTSTISGDLNVSGTSTLSGPTVVSDTSIGTNIPHSVYQTFNSASTTLCAVTNTSGILRRIIAAGVETYVQPADSAGTILVNMGTSTNAFTTSTSPFVATTIISRTDLSVITSTSTQRTIPWQTGEVVIAKTDTTTQSGVCSILFY